MGKNRVIKSLARWIGNVVMHKLLLKRTSKPEAAGHLKSEIEEYGIDAFEKAQEFNWNEQDKKEIEEKAKERVENLIKNYLDIRYTEKEVEELIKETINELL